MRILVQRKFVYIIIRKILFIFLIMNFTACIEENNGDVQLETALNFAGNNRYELEKVLKFYQNSPQKLEAAKFLIRNMPHWYCYEGWPLDSIKTVLSYIASSDDVYVMTERQKAKWQKFPFYSLPKVYDSHVITSEFLTNNIEEAFKAWTSKAWNKSLSFEDFCELILPYRVGNERLTNWRTLYKEYYAHILDSLYHGSDVVEACRIVNEELLKQNFKYNVELSLPHIDATFLFFNRVGSCRESCDLGLYAMRACGIPVAAEFFKYSPDYQNAHQWLTLRDTTGTFIQFGYDNLIPRRGISQTDDRKKGKVYRFCYSLQTEQKKNIKEIANIPEELQDFYIKDVTKNYFGENSTIIPIQTQDKSIFLGVFTVDDWKPIDIGKIRNDSVIFRNIEPNIIYQPITFTKEGRYKPVGYPFIYYSGKRGTLILKPNTTYQNLILERKMPLLPRVRKWFYEGILGAKIEASKNISFSAPRTLYEFKDTLDYCYYKLQPCSSIKYRFLRYSVPKGSRIELADLGVYEDSLRKNRLPIKLITKIDSVYAPNNIIDGNMLTPFRGTKKCNSIIFDLSKETRIGCIDFYPRNDGNFIWPGDIYELYYQDGINGWKSLGKQKAKGRKLRYKGPQNALFWLRNLTRGEEEQVFIYNNEQQFVYDIK